MSNEVTPALGDDGYLVETSGGAVLGFGDLQSHGGIAGQGERAAGIATTPDGLGYWVVTSTGSVTAFGDAPFLGDTATTNVTGIASLPAGDGYWIVTKSGVVHAFGRAKTFAGKLPAGADVVAIASSPDGKGYLLVTSNGAVTAFGDAHAYGSLTGKHASTVRRGDRRHPEREGLLARHREWRGLPLRQRPGLRLPARNDSSQPIVAIAATPDSYGYWLVSSSGKVYNFGAALNLGSTTSAVAIGI